ncbi:MAG TPA: hypothetical protein VHC68_03530 [Candidatus Paceibacterota bacterium]|nr:hypothetical protein [Candidatus Paceibacterota bacterium]
MADDAAEARGHQPAAGSPESAEGGAEKFVRTFASDAEAIQSGKAPGFTKKEGGPKAQGPHDLASDTAAATAAALAAPAAEQPAPAPPPPAPPPPAPRPAPPPLPPLPPSLVPEPQRAAAEAAARPAPLHTYTSDFAAEVREREASQADILAAESDRPRHAPVLFAAKDSRLAAAAVALVVVGALAAFGAYLYAARPTTVAVATAPGARIFVDEQEALAGEGATLAAAIERSVANPPAANGIRLLTLASSSESVFTALALPAPAILLRNLESAGSLAGIVNADNGASPFFILSVDSYSDTFAGMLDWEPAMGHDFAALYPPYAATGTPPVFRDETILNHDVRAELDSQGRTVLLYGYFDPSTLIIARDEEALAAVLDRLTNSRTQSQ